jgi:hypothetical protein
LDTNVKATGTLEQKPKEKGEQGKRKTQKWWESKLSII